MAKSAILYCLRCLIGIDIPLNAGCLAPADVRIPAGTILCPSEHVAVSSGNTETSQRVADVVFKAFEATAASQGVCTNSLIPASLLTLKQVHERLPSQLQRSCLRRDDLCKQPLALRSLPDLKLICQQGGHGAGPSWAGESGVQINMTNTRCSDHEILESRFPMILREFSIREGSGGKGKNRGGNGVHREFEFLVPTSVSLPIAQWSSIDEADRPLNRLL